MKKSLFILSGFLLIVTSNSGIYYKWLMSKKIFNVRKLIKN